MFPGESIGMAHRNVCFVDEEDSFHVMSYSLNQTGQPELIYVCHSNMIQTVSLTKMDVDQMICAVKKHG